MTSLKMFSKVCARSSRRTIARLHAIVWVGLGVCAALSSSQTRAADVPALTSAKDIVAKMVANEDVAVRHKDHYAYASKERSERTGGHLWSEKVVETDAGKVRMLVAEDGHPLTPERIAIERGRLAAIAANPGAFQKKEQGLRNDETHAKDMLSLLPKAFLFGDVREENGYLHIDFTPNPNYVTQSMEEHVLHGMSGSLLIDPQSMRLHHIEGRLAQDVSLGFGLLATIRSGSSFATTRDRLGEPDWKTTTLDTDIDGKAIFFKVIAKKEHAEHSDFVRIANDMTVPQAVALAER
jgi:hypothetical protein